MKVTVAKYILDFLAEQGIQHVFGITGGAIAFVIDEFHGRKDIKFVPMLHEQAAAMAADAYARVHKSKLGATMVTSGPGAVNLLTGIACSYFDSIPTIHITGNVNTFDQGQRKGIRQIGFQETNIMDMAKPITKYSDMLLEAEAVRWMFEKALYYAKEGRPGPVLLDIPQNLQRVLIDPKKLQGFTPPKKKEIDLTEQALKLLDMLRKARKPLVLVGNGARGSDVDQFLTSNILPFVTSWSAMDMFDHGDSLRVGKIGVYGDRGANLALQDCDLLISLGSRLDTRQIGSMPDKVAPKAKRVVVDIDANELNKGRGMKIHLAINAKVSDFLAAYPSRTLILIKKEWFEQCVKWKHAYPMTTDKYRKQKKNVNAYVFNDILSDLLPSDAHIIPCSGGNLTWTMQAFKIKLGQTLFSAFGNSPMGYAVPASIGAAIATKKPIICIEGDGGLQINIQELQTIVANKLPIKIFIMDNNGYGIIKQFQKVHLNSRFQATDVSTGVTRPNFISVAKAYGIKTFTIKANKNLESTIKKVLKYEGPVLCNVIIDELQPLIPKLDYGDTLENMSPKL